MRQFIYRLYRRRLRSAVTHLPVPRHVGIILDGNRRWAATQGATTKRGHEAGAAKVAEFLGWCEDLGVEIVTLWLLSTDNLNRDSAEVNSLLAIIDDTVRQLAGSRRWRIHPMGYWDELPQDMRENLQRIKDRCATADGMLVNVAVGYGGRREVVDAVRSLLHEHAEQGTPLDELAQLIDIDHIAEHLYTKGQPDPDLVIRTSGEQRLGGFLLWQSQYSEFWFCEAYWPDFREIDFLRAVRSYGGRQRRFGA